MIYTRPLVQVGPSRPVDAVSLAGGWGWFTHVELLARDQAPRIVPAEDAPPEDIAALTAPRAPIAGLCFERPHIMGILNTTPDSFSDGGKHSTVEQAVQAAGMMAEQGADLLDIGGESTRPGAAEVRVGVEIERTARVIEVLSERGNFPPISIDTRKALVAEAALTAGARLVNDVSGFLFDPALAPLCAARSAPVCVMHSIGTPQTMQGQAQYGDVLLDVYDHLADRIMALVARGVPRASIIADPGIGFAKTLEHNVALLSRLSLFHSLGVPVLLGASRKRFIGTLGGGGDAQSRMPGSLAVAQAAAEQGVQIVRVHDVAETAQAFALWSAARGVTLPRA